MKVIAFAAIVLLVAWPAAAELTLAEKAELSKYDAAGAQLETALWYLGSALQYTTAENRGDLSEAWAYLIVAHKALHDAIGLLLGASIDQSGVWPTLPRASFLATAWFFTQRAEDHLAGAVPSLNRAEAAGGSPEYLDAVRRARDIWLVGALAALQSVDQTLPYADPRPLSYPRIVGAQGVYDKAQFNVVHALRFLAESWDSAREMYTADEPLWSSYHAFYRILLRGTEVPRKMRHAMLNWAIIPTSPAECAMNRFHLVAASFGPLLSNTSASQGVDGLPYHANQLLGDALPEMLQQTATRPIGRAALGGFLQRWSDFWRYSDGAAWQAVQLAAGDPPSDPESLPSAPPLCP